MAKVEISEQLKQEIFKKFKEESKEIFKLMYSLGENPKKGKELGHISGIVIKEIKYNSYRFYFVTDGYKLRIFEPDKLKDLLIKFVRMSDKKDQQKVIDEIKSILKNFGEESFR